MLASALLSPGIQMLLFAPLRGVLPSGKDQLRAVVAAGVTPGTSHDSRVRRGVGFLLASARRALCALDGHDMIVQFEPTRLSMRCSVCGAETPGWRLDVSPKFRPHRGDRG